MPTQPNSNLEMRVGSALPSSVCLFFFSRIERLSSKLDALTQFSAPLLLTGLKEVGNHELSDQVSVRLD